MKAKKCSINQVDSLRTLLFSWLSNRGLKVRLAAYQTIFCKVHASLETRGGICQTRFRDRVVLP